MDKLSSMQAFIQVARLGSFSAAAQKLGISKAMVSKHIKRLEDSLEVQLLNRTTRHLSLTETGIVYRDRVREILDDIEETEVSVSRHSTEPSGTLRVISPASFGSFHLSRAVSDYLKEYPKVSIELFLTERTPDLVEEGLDLAIRVGTLEDSGLFARRLTSVRMVVCGAPAYFDLHGIPRTPAELVQHNCLVQIAHTNAEAWTFKTDKGNEKLPVQGSVRSNASDALRIAAIHGTGLISLPIYMVDLDIKSGRLSPVLVEYESAPRPIHALYRHRLHMSAKVKTFVEYLHGRFESMPTWETSL